MSKIDEAITKVGAAPTVKGGVEILLNALSNEAHDIFKKLKAAEGPIESQALAAWVKLENELHLLFAEGKSKAAAIAIAIEANLDHPHG